MVAPDGHESEEEEDEEEEEEEMAVFGDGVPRRKLRIRKAENLPFSQLAGYNFIVKPLRMWALFEQPFGSFDDKNNKITQLWSVIPPSVATDSVPSKSTRDLVSSMLNLSWPNKRC